MAVEVYVWLPFKMDWSNSTVSPAALSVDGGDPAGKEYLSLYPVMVGTTFFDKMVDTFASLGGNKNVYFRKKEEDLSEEGKPLTVRLTKLDETRIKNSMSLLKQDPGYAFLGYNCATQIGVCLDAGVPGSIVRQWVDTSGHISPSYFAIADKSQFKTPYGGTNTRKVWRTNTASCPDKFNCLGSKAQNFAKGTPGMVKIPGVLGVKFDLLSLPNSPFNFQLVFTHNLKEAIKVREGLIDWQFPLFIR